MSENMQDKTCYPALAVETTTAITPELVHIREQSHDDRILELWLHGRSRHTQRAYRSDVDRFRRWSGKSLAQMTLADLQRYADHLEHTQSSSTTRHRALSSIKSLFHFGHRLGYLPFDTAAALRLPTVRETLAERILEEDSVRRLLQAERNPRNKAILSLLYAAGLRVSELAALRWKDVQSQGDGSSQITVLGKGQKTRSIKLPASTGGLINRLRSTDVSDLAPIFVSLRSQPISTSQILRIVKSAARKAGISSNVVAHTLRHCHASHALDRGAPIHLVQQTLGHADISTTGRYLHARPCESSGDYLDLI